MLLLNTGTSSQAQQCCRHFAKPNKSIFCKKIFTCMFCIFLQFSICGKNFKSFDQAIFELSWVCKTQLVDKVLENILHNLNTIMRNYCYHVINVYISNFVCNYHDSRKILKKCSFKTNTDVPDTGYRHNPTLFEVFGIPYPAR